MRRIAVVVAVAAVTGCGGGVTPRSTELAMSMQGRDGRGDIFLVNTASGLHTNITETADDEETSPSWSPDGRQIVFSSQYEDADGEIRTDLFVINSDGTGRRRLTRSDEVEETSPSWSPGGSLIAFVRGTVGHQIWTMKPDGTGARPIASVGYFPRSPTWAPDGRRLAFSATAVDDQMRIWVVDAAGGRPSAISKGNIDKDPVWSQQGVVFTRGFTVIAVDPDTGAERELDNSALVVSPSPDGEWLAIVDLDGLSIKARDAGFRRLVLSLQETGLVFSPPAWRP